MASAVPNGESEVLWDDGEFILSRVRQSTDRNPTLLVRLATANPAAASLAWLEQAHALRAELDAAWTARPLELVNRVAAGVASAVGGLHRRGLLHKDVKPSNILIDSRTGEAWGWPSLCSLQRPQ
jgi:serine/threonine protein kinase